jgi:fucose permease
MPEPYSTITAVLIVAMVAVIATTRTALRRRLTSRTAVGLYTLTAITASVRAYLTEDWPWDLVNLLCAIFLTATWATIPTKREREQQQESQR